MGKEINNTNITTTIEDQEYYQEHNLTGLHSEDFMRFLFTKKYPVIPLTQKDICFQRVRSNGFIKTDDCDVMYNITSTPTTTAGEEEKKNIINVEELLPVFDKKE